jgi:beta-glucanase (GH16 family)
MKIITQLFILFFVVFDLTAQRNGREEGIAIPQNYHLVWSEEFDENGQPDDRFWGYEEGFVRNVELQWYQRENAYIRNGVLVIEGRREEVKNPDFEENHDDWRKNRAFAHYTSSCLHTRGKMEFQYGILEVRAKIDTATGMWPAIWTLGVSGRWPANGEIDIMEYYLVDGEPTILANAAWAHPEKRAAWDEVKLPFSYFSKKDADWHHEFHVWSMDWTEEYIRLYLDGELLNEIDLENSLNPDGTNPFHQPHYLLLNLAIGSNGGNPSETVFPRKYEIDYVRLYQKNNISNK